MVTTLARHGLRRPAAVNTYVHHLGPVVARPGSNATPNALTATSSTPKAARISEKVAESSSPPSAAVKLVLDNLNIFLERIDYPLPCFLRLSEDFHDTRINALLPRFGDFLLRVLSVTGRFALRSGKVASSHFSD